MLSAQNQRNRALKRAFEGTTAGSVLASAGALPDAIAPQATPDEKFLSLNRWRKPSGGALQELAAEHAERERVV